MDQYFLPKLKFLFKNNIKCLKENPYIDFTFLEDVVVHTIKMLSLLFVQLPISSPVLLCYSLVDMCVNISKHKLEKLLFHLFNAVIIVTRKQYKLTNNSVIKQKKKQRKKRKKHGEEKEEEH